MIPTKSLYTLLCISLLFTACKPENLTNIETIVDEVKTVENQAVVQNTDPERSYWQKPDLVMEKLGNLEEDVIADINSRMVG